MHTAKRMNRRGGGFEEGDGVSASSHVYAITRVRHHISCMACLGKQGKSNRYRAQRDAFHSMEKSETGTPITFSCFRFDRVGLYGEGLRILPVEKKLNVCATLSTTCTPIPSDRACKAWRWSYSSLSLARGVNRVNCCEGGLPCHVVQTSTIPLRSDT